MGFFDNLSNSISQGATKATEKAKEIAEVTKLQSSINSENKVIDAAYSELGKAFFEQFKDDVVAKFPEIAEKVDTALANIEAAKKAIIAAKGSQVCPQCGKEVAKDTKFCPACGAQMPVVEAPVEEAAPAGVKCPACGAELPEGTAFCTKCGAKIG